MPPTSRWDLIQGLKG